jgi:hypothetical protein
LRVDGDLRDLSVARIVGLNQLGRSPHESRLGGCRHGGDPKHQTYPDGERDHSDNPGHPSPRYAKQ